MKRGRNPQVDVAESVLSEHRGDKEASLVFKIQIVSGPSHSYLPGDVTSL